MSNDHKRYRLGTQSYIVIQEWLRRNLDSHRLRVEAKWNNELIRWFEIDFERSSIRSVSTNVTNDSIFVYLTSVESEFRVDAYEFCKAFHKLHRCKTVEIKPLNTQAGVVLRLSLRKSVKVYAPKMEMLERLSKYED